MTVKIEEGRDVFELNNGLARLFPKLDASEMEYVVYVADMNSIFRMKKVGERRLLALRVVDGLWLTGKPTVKGQKILDGKNKDVESAIVEYHKSINNNKGTKLMRTLDTLNEYYDSVLGFMKKLDDKGEFDEQVKIYANNAKSIKDETIKATYEQIKYFENELSFEFEIPDDVKEDTEEKDVINTTTADNIDVDKLVRR
jgi:hypothetical protein